MADFFLFRFLHYYMYLLGEYGVIAPETLVERDIHQRGSV